MVSFAALVSLLVLLLVDASVAGASPGRHASADPPASQPPHYPSPPAYGDGSGGARTFTNPILKETGADPWMVKGGDGWYYLTYTTGSDIVLLRSRSIVEWDSAARRTIFTPPANKSYSTDLWAPEIHFFPDRSRWYVVFTADPMSDSPIPSVDMLCTFSCPAVHHRMYVLESSTRDIWTSTYALKARLNTFDQFAIDGTYFRHRARLYHVYSCWASAYESWPANLCITHLANPWTVSSSLAERRTISEPTQPWEKTPYNRTVNVRLSTNEGPQQLVNPRTGQVFVVYSAGRSDNANYCLGLLELRRDGDPMNPAHWTKSDGCVFYENPAEHVYGVGHASFVTSPDGTEDWIVYHGMRNPKLGWADRTIRAQRFTWGRDGRPLFPRPGLGPYKRPSGE